MSEEQINWEPCRLMAPVIQKWTGKLRIPQCNWAPSSLTLYWLVGTAGYERYSFILGYPNSIEHRAFRALEVPRHFRELNNEKTEETRFWEPGCSLDKHTAQTTADLVLSTAPTPGTAHWVLQAGSGPFFHIYFPSVKTLMSHCFHRALTSLILLRPKQPLQLPQFGFPPLVLG